MGWLDCWLVAYDCCFAYVWLLIVLSWLLLLMLCLGGCLICFLGLWFVVFFGGLLLRFGFVGVLG